MALLLGLVVGPETHVHKGEGLHSEAVVHVHFGVAGHVHGRSPSRPRLSENDASGPAVYLDAHSSITTRAITVPVFHPNAIYLFALTFTSEIAFSGAVANAHAPPLIESIRPRSPPLICSA